MSLASASALATARAARPDLLDRLCDLFLAEGFRHFGVGDLAARLRCSRSTLYQVAASKEQIVLATVRWYFRRAAERIEEQVQASVDPAERVRVYLTAVAAELEPASPAFFADVAAFEPARDAYRDNTRAAAGRVRALVAAGIEAGALRPVDASFVGMAVAQVMAAIQTGEFGRATGHVDAEAYRLLADLILTGLVNRPAV